MPCDFVIDLQTIKKLDSGLEILQKLSYELQLSKLAENTEILGGSLMNTDPKAPTIILWNWDADKTKTFVENLNDFVIGFQQVMKELNKNELKKIAGDIIFMLPKTSPEEIPAGFSFLFSAYDFLITIDEKALIKGEKALWNEFIEITKRIASALPTDYAIAYIDGEGSPVLRRMEKLFKRQKVLKEIPRLDKIVPKSVVSKWKGFYNPYPSIIILSPERYQLSKPYLSDAPIKSMEELDNGCVFLFFGYPIDFEAFRRRVDREEKEESKKRIFEGVAVLRPNEDLDVACERITKAFEKGGFEVYHPIMLNEMLPISDFARLFIIFTEKEAHTFFICPYEWTDERILLMLEAIEAVKEVQGVGKHIIHFISAYPLPEVLKELSE